MKSIEYCPDGEAIADAKAEERARAFLLSTETDIKVSTDNFITVTRTLIHEGVIPHTEVHFLFEGEKLQPDKHGRLPHWPWRFCSYSEDFLSRLLAPPREPT